MIIVYGLLGLGLVILVHEAGHFLAARAVGIEVEVFSIGWGKKLIGFRRGATEYRISMVPLGGFAKMKGDTAYRRALEEGHSEIQLEEHSFFSATPWQRIIVAAAGPVMNLLFAVLVLFLINLIGFDYSSFSNRVILVDDFPTYHSLPTDNSPANRAGVRTGDRITAVNGNRTDNFTMLQQEIASRALETVSLSIERDGEEIVLEPNLMLDETSGAGILGIFPYVEPVIADAGTSAGLEPEDRIVMVNGQEVKHSYDVQTILDNVAASEKQVSLTIQRGNRTLVLEEDLMYNEETQSFSLGYRYATGTYRKASGGFFQAIADGWKESFETLAVTFKGLSLLFRGLKPGVALSGPVRITVLVGEVTAQGLSRGIGEGLRSFFHLLSLLSVALCFGNLLPIPVLDGGQILIFLAEAIKRSPISPKTFFRYQTFGAIIVIGLIAFVLVNDLLFVLGRT